ncbi:hypothetical protein D3C87_2066850 [compost metagenome]
MLRIVSFQKGSTINGRAYGEYPPFGRFSGQLSYGLHRTEVEQHHLDQQTDIKLDGNQNVQAFDELQIGQGAYGF